MAAETAGMTADHSESHESSWHLDRHSIFEKAALDAANGVPSGSYVQKEFPLERADSLLDSQSEQSAVIPAVSAAICVSLFSLVCRRSVVPSPRRVSLFRRRRSRLREVDLRRSLLRFVRRIEVFPRLRTSDFRGDDRRELPDQG